VKGAEPPQGPPEGQGSNRLDQEPKEGVGGSVSLLSNTFVLTPCGWTTAEQACVKGYPIATCGDPASLVLYTLAEGRPSSFPNVMSVVKFEVPTKWCVHVAWAGVGRVVISSSGYSCLLPDHAELLPAYGSGHSLRSVGNLHRAVVCGYDQTLEVQPAVALPIISCSHINLASTLFTPEVPSGFVLVGMSHGSEIKVVIAVAPKQLARSP
jgi:hypothetical protein